MTHGRIIPGENSVEFEAPDYLGINCEVQHPARMGKPVTPRPGVFGVSVVAMPDGLPRILMQLSHSDETTLTAVLTPADVVAVMDCFRSVAADTKAIYEAAKATRQ